MIPLAKDNLTKADETTDDLEYTLETLACIGASALTSTMTIDNETHGKMTAKKVALAAGYCGEGLACRIHQPSTIFLYSFDDPLGSRMQGVTSSLFCFSSYHNRDCFNNFRMVLRDSLRIEPLVRIYDEHKNIGLPYNFGPTGMADSRSRA